MRKEQFLRIKGLCIILTANVFVNIPVKSIAKAFTYRVPDDLSYLKSGWRVLVPFGGRKVEGFILEVKERELVKGEAAKIKEILSAVDDEAWFSPVLLAASQWLSSFYLCSLAEVMRLFMPGKSGLKIMPEYQAVVSSQSSLVLQQKSCRSIYGYLQSHQSCSKAELRRFARQQGIELDATLAKLLRAQLVRKSYTAKKRDIARYQKMIHMVLPLTEEKEKEYRRKKAQLRLWNYLMEQKENSVSWDNLKQHAFSMDSVKHLEADGVVQIEEHRILRDSYADTASQRKEIVLSADQEKAIGAVVPFLQKREHHGFLLHGVTGSGKTQVYIELARKTREMGRSVIVLVPEIALTGQLVVAFKTYFKKDIIVIHSRLTLSERNDAVHRVRRGEAGIIIGARSALFTPAEDVGLIILDEEQDMSYKQDESPRYHAKVVAEKLAELHGAVLLLGSATPSMESYYRAKKGELTLLTMPKRIHDIPLPEICAVDMRKELKTGNRHIISRSLEALIKDTMNKHQQVIIMLNRRGYATFVMCRSCGAVIKCPECGLPMVYHQTQGRRILLCHHCDIRQEVPTVCPTCGSRYIKYFGSGTEKLEQELRTLVPQARVIRMDRDTTTGKFSHQEILSRFKHGDYDILLGTQMVAKGHDIPNVMAVGIISADSCLNVPDFRAAERCFMLITQTAGRAGRTEREDSERGHVIVQTYNTEHYAVQCGIAQDYEGFYAQEIKMREALQYPPFTRLVKLIFQNEDAARAKQEAESLVLTAQKRLPAESGTQILGPAPALVARFRRVYRFVVLFKTHHLSMVQKFLRDQSMHLRTDVAIDIDPISMS